MNKILHIAYNTFRESVRDKVLYVIAFFGVLMMIASVGLGWVAVGQQAQIVTDFSLAVVCFFGALIAVFVGTGLIYKEIDKRTIYTVLSKPVHRWHFILGKYFGLLALLGCMIVGMGVISSGFVLYAGGSLSLMYYQALFLIYLELAIVTAVAIFFSTVSSPILSAIFTFCTFLVGQVTPNLLDLVSFKPKTESVAELTGEHLTDFVSQTHWLLKPIGQLMYMILPDFTHFQLYNRVVHGPDLLPGEFLYSVGYAFCYSLIVLFVSVFLFERRRF